VGMVARYNQFDVHLIALSPTEGSEINKTRPCVIISPNEMNIRLETVIVAPMTSAKKGYPTRCACVFNEKSGEIALDQIRTVSKTRLLKKLGTLNPKTANKVLSVLQEMFA
jgi:mRNA interferase MazF